MMMFRAKAHYAGGIVEVEAEDFKALHRVLASLAELEACERMLVERGVEHVVPEFHIARQGDKKFEYYGLTDGDAPGSRVVTFGEHIEPRSAVPFFPKPDDGYYEAQGAPPAPHQARPAAQAAERPREATPAAEGHQEPRLTRAQADKIVMAMTRSAWTKLGAAAWLGGHYGVERVAELLHKDFEEALETARDAKAAKQWDLFAATQAS